MPYSIVTANRLCNHVTGQTPDTPPANVWLTLFDDTAANSGLVNNSFANELGGNWARFAINTTALDVTNGFTQIGTGVLANNGIWQLGTASGVAWSNIRSFATVDSATLGAGNILSFGDATAAVTVNDGEELEIAAQTLTFDGSLAGTPTTELSTDAQDKMVLHIHGIQQWNIPARYSALFFGASGLSTNAPTQEITEGTYARQLTGPFGAAVNGQASNSNQIQWDKAIADYDNAGQVSHHAMMDAVTAGNVILWNTATITIILAGVTPRMDAGTFQPQVNIS